MKVLVDHGSGNNIGDQAMLESVVSNLSDLLPNAELYVVRRAALPETIYKRLDATPVPQYEIKRPYQFANLSLLDIARRKFWSGIYRAFYASSNVHQAAFFSIIQKCKLASKIMLTGSDNITLGDYCANFDSLHVAGGGNLTDTFPYHLFHRVALMETFYIQQKPIILTGQQIGPFSSRLHKSLVIRALKHASFIGLREPTLSVEILQEGGVDRHKYSVMGDDALGLLNVDKSDEPLIKSRTHYHQYSYFVVNIRIGRTYAKEHEKHLRLLAQVVDQLASHYRLPALVVPIALQESDSDIESGHRLAALTTTAQVEVLEKSDLSPIDVKSIIGSSLGAVGVSYHFCTFALSQGVPAVCLFDGDYYKQKALGLAKYWRDQRIGLPLNGSDPSNVANHVIIVWNDHLLRERLVQLSAEVTSHWRRSFQSAIEVLCQSSNANQKQLKESSFKLKV
jgi:polysaccharide pyruvyl transferase WcaK-like protein